MRSRSTGAWAFRKSRRIARIPCRVRCIWNLSSRCGGLMNKLTVVFILATLLLSGSSAMAASTSKTVSYKSGDESVQGILYTPQGKGPFPAVIVIHEWWGLNDWVKEQAQRISDLGYVALAVDLYRGTVATTPDEAHELMRGVPEDRAARDLHAAFEFLKSQSNVKP